MYIVLAILIFGLLIATHELGHFIAAKCCGVRVLEFSIGMGPTLLKKQGKETLYSWRLLPIGGFCAMEGEDEASEDPHAFSNQKTWKRVIILIAGAGTNFITGLILIAVVFATATGFNTPTISGFMDGFPMEGEDGFMVGDTVYQVDGQRTYFSSNVTMLLGRAGESTDVVVIRDGEKITLHNVSLKAELPDTDSSGNTTLKYGLYFDVQPQGLGAHLKYTFYCALDFVRLVRLGLVDLVTGAVGLREMSGPVGIVSLINETGQSAATTGAGLRNVVYLAAFIAINLAVMNMLPIPALDGGRVLFLIITWVAERIIRRKINPKYEGYIHAAGLLLLVGLMIIVMFNDVVKLFQG